MLSIGLLYVVYAISFLLALIYIDTSWAKTAIVIPILLHLGLLIFGMILKKIIFPCISNVNIEAYPHADLKSITILFDVLQGIAVWLLLNEIPSRNSSMRTAAWIGMIGALFCGAKQIPKQIPTQIPKQKNGNRSTSPEDWLWAIQAVVIFTGIAFEAFRSR